MVIKYRGDLTKLFNNNAVPEAKNFETLINSVLVKRDDQFFGKWQPGVGYVENDVVIWNNIFYYFVKAIKTGDDKDCNCDDCGNKAPDANSCCWQPVRFDVNDHDWEFIYDKLDKTKKVGLFAAATGKVGIGTGENAAAFFHVNDDKSGCGQLLFNPLNTEGGKLPMLKMVNLSLNQKSIDGESLLKPDFVSQSMDENKVINLTSTQGYVFRQKPVSELGENWEEIAEEDTSKHLDDEDTAKSETTEGFAAPISSDKSLLIITATDNKPRVGIGTEKPEATLDLYLPGRGQIRADAGEDNVPDLTLVYKSFGHETYLTEAIDENQAALVTNAKEGFVFKSDRSHAERFRKCGNERMKSGRSLMVVQPDESMHVKVGIGTTDPQTQVEVDGKEGKIQMSLNESNPSLNIINKVERGGQTTETNFLAMGAVGVKDDQIAVFSTNSQNGFVFRHTRHQGDTVPGVNRGTKFLYLKQEKNQKDAPYAMIMDGRIAAKGFYAAAAPDEASPVPKNTALKLICDFKPTFFNASDEDERQYGFLADEMPNGLEGLVNSFVGLGGKEGDAIAYHSIVTLLVGAVKDLSSTVHELKERVKKLENRGSH